MNAITTFKPSVRGMMLVARAREDAGASNPVSEGAMMLAEFLADRATHPLVDFLGGWSVVSRLLADGYMPGNDIGEEMGRLTNGVLTPELWRRPWVDDAAAPARVLDEIAGEMLGAVTCATASIGAVGTIPPGPLFRFRAVADEPSLRQIVGFGLAIECSDPVLCALRDAVVAAIADLRAGDAG